MGWRVAGINIYEFIVSSTLLTVLLYFVIGYSIPFSWWVSINETTYNDVCVGDSSQFVQSTRTPLFNIPGHAQSQVVEFNDDRRIETSITRETDLLYDTGDYVEYRVTWDKPFNHTGVYGALSVVEINPLPFIKKTTVFPAEDRIFNVIDCE